MNKKQISKEEFDSLVPKDLRCSEFSTEVTPGGVYVFETWHLEGKQVHRVGLQGADGYMYYLVAVSRWSLLNPFSWFQYLRS